MMTRKLAVALALALFAAAPAAVAQTIHISTAGKSPAQVDQEIRAAAHDVCWASYSAMPTPLTAYGACLKSQIKSAHDQLRTGSLAQVPTDTVLR